MYFERFLLININFTLYQLGKPMFTSYTGATNLLLTHKSVVKSIPSNHLDSEAITSKAGVSLIKSGLTAPISGFMAISSSLK